MVLPELHLFQYFVEEYEAGDDVLDLLEADHHHGAV